VLAEEEDALLGLAAGVLGVAHPNTFGEGGAWRLVLRFNSAISLRNDLLLAVNLAT
jgi:hypothetical protein